MIGAEPSLIVSQTRQRRRSGASLARLANGRVLGPVISQRVVGTAMHADALAPFADLGRDTQPASYGSPSIYGKASPSFRTILICMRF
jgi:hypothetical protein